VWKLKPKGYSFSRFPWSRLSKDPTRFIEPGSLPLAFHLKDPGDLSSKDIVDLWKHVNRRQQSGRALALRFTDEVYKITMKKVYAQGPLKGDLTPQTSLNLSADLLCIEPDDDPLKGGQAGPATVKSNNESDHDPGAHLLRTPPTGSQHISQHDTAPLNSLDVLMSADFPINPDGDSPCSVKETLSTDLLFAAVSVPMPVELDSETGDTSQDLSTDLLYTDDSAKGSQAGPATVNSDNESDHDPGAHPPCDVKLLRTPPPGSRHPSEHDPAPLTSFDLSMSVDFPIESDDDSPPPTDSLFTPVSIPRKRKR
jgi:hypothetical protein